MFSIKEFARLMIHRDYSILSSEEIIELHKLEKKMEDDKEFKNEVLKEIDYQRYNSKQNYYK